MDQTQGGRSYKSASDVGYGSIRITSDINGMVNIDKKVRKWINIGEEQEYLKLQEGEHEVSVIASGGKSITKKVMVQESQVTPLKMSDNKPDKNMPVGSIRVFNMEKVQKCKVYIDNEYMSDLAPNEEKDYAATSGKHRVEIHFPEDILSKILIVEESKISELRARLKAPMNLRIMQLLP